ncbi:helix-hairpin-helix domain-containing protein [Opitutus sp. GAS368]|uniref:helix-hairpin-helix domain-containing protein n=1 Tax=Opitutus sp. GAS368 TaxID=1882749 RepID=UPI00087CE73E|nr:helix-hairpin-helix domain-containing protein [Opitutus sp. GAS368]SDS45956.1 DNA polymerase (family 10) [Opitutus sp. GAS368]
MNKTEIAAVLTEIGTLLELKGENPFKTRAYQAGARVVESLGEDELKARVADGTLQEVKGIGEALAQKITELSTTGRLEFFDQLKASVPAGLVEIMAIPGMGPKKVRALQEKLGVDTIAKLRAACAENRVAALDGFGEKTQERILAGIRNREAYNKRHLWFVAAEAAAPILAGLQKLPGVKQVESCGSLRRRMETVGDIDFLVATTEPAPIVEWFVTQPGIKEVTARGETKASVRLESGLQADLRLVPPEQFVFTLHHLTGSKDHNVQMRQRALARGFSMSEWGLFPSDQKHGPTEKEKPETGDLRPEGKDKKKPESPGASSGFQVSGFRSQVSVKTESDLFKALGLHFVSPELREGHGEIELAEKDALPQLLEEADIRGVFHNHTTASDGHNTLEEMVAATQALGLDYLGIADHSKSSVQARGLTEERLAAQIGEIGKLNAAKKFKCHVFTGTECDILPDGKLDFDQGILAQLDYTVVSVHSSFRQERDVMTKRIIRAIEQPHVTMLGHLTGRLLLEREGYEVDVDKVVDAAIANGVVIELNANPWRLDLDWRHWRKAAEKGLLTSINPDAHRTEQLAFYKIGVGIARKGWLTKDQVVTTKPLAAMKQWLAAKR